MWSSFFLSDLHLLKYVFSPVIRNVGHSLVINSGAGNIRVRCNTIMVRVTFRITVRIRLHLRFELHLGLKLHLGLDLHM